ncbi:MAG TPA: polysaccharide biosynthesis/export family protein, partial [Methylocystis sp.]|nr:polysaccharide biosynthesis/export family protein [Methylocystis sp.]
PEAKRLAQDVGGFIAASAPGNSAYQIGAQDVLEVVVFKAPELTRSVQVADGGTINLPLVGEIVAAGKTSAQVERELASRLGATYMRNPQVNVYVKEFNSQRVTVEGAVKTPGVYPLRGKTSLMQALATAQGTDRDVASSNVMVFRTVDDQRVAAEFDVDAIRSGQAQDPLLRNGDVVVVPTSGSKVVFQNFIKITPLLAAFRPSVL